MSARRSLVPRVRTLAVATAVLVLVLALAAPPPARGQIAGENVNMVTGTGWPDGDRFLQRQNEPSIAVSSANAQHLLAGANDYRTVDLPDPFADVTKERMPGDAWAGVFKSLDGGQTWRSALLPGYPQDASAEGAASPLRVCGAGADGAPIPCTAAADPVVRAGTDGLLFFGGIVFHRGTNHGKVFLSRFLDRNDRESAEADGAGDPIAYLDTKVVAEGDEHEFLDKPWIAVDVPRPLFAKTCTLRSPDGTTLRSFRHGAVYVTYVRFVDGGGSDVLLKRSLDCGETWSAEVKLNDATSAVNQGPSIAIDPVLGHVYVAWRRIASGGQTDAVMVARSFSLAKAFTRPKVIAEIAPFDQGTSGTRFRTLAFPTIAVSTNGGLKRWAHVAWSQRSGPDGDARVVMSTAEVSLLPTIVLEALDGSYRDQWSAPAAIDDAPLTDGAGAFERGHQFMPALTFSQGRLMLVHYDSRFDHTRSFYAPYSPFEPDLLGRFYREQRAPLTAGPDHLFDPPEAIFTRELDDCTVCADASAPGGWRQGLTHVRHTLEARVGAARPGPAPVFATTEASRFRFGVRGDEIPGLTVPSFGTEPLEVVAADGTLKLVQQLQVNPPNLPMFKNGTAPFIGDYIDIQGPAFVPLAGGWWAFNVKPTAAPVFHAIWTSNQDVVPPADGDWTKYTPIGGGQSTYDPTKPRPACASGLEASRDQNVYTSRITEGLLVSSPQNAKPLRAGAVASFVVLAQNTTTRELTLRLSLAATPADVLASFEGDPAVAPVRRLDLVVAPHSHAYRTLFVTLAPGSTRTTETLAVNVSQLERTATCSVAAGSCPVLAGGLSGFVTLNPPGSVPTLSDLAGGEAYAVLVVDGGLDSANFRNANFRNPGVTNADVETANFRNADLANFRNDAEAANFRNETLADEELGNANFRNANFRNANFRNENLTDAPVTDVEYELRNTGNTTTAYRIELVGQKPADGTPLQLIVTKAYTTPAAVDCTLVERPRRVLLVNVPDVTPAIVPPGALVQGGNDPSESRATVSLAPGERAKLTLRGIVTLAEMAEIAGMLTPVAIPQALATRPPPGTTYESLPGARAPTATTLAITAGGALVATVSGGAVPPTGDVTFILGRGAVESIVAVAALSGGAAVVDAPATQPGDVLTARYAGDALHAGSSATFVVSQAPTQLAVSAAPFSIYPAAVTIDATVTSAAGTPGGGVVTFLADGIDLGTATVVAGQASFTTPPGFLAPGTHLLAASYGGDASFAGSTTPIVQTHPVLLTTRSSFGAPGAAGLGTSYTFQLDVFADYLDLGPPTGTVAFLVEGGARVPGTCAASGVYLRCVIPWTFTQLGVRSLHPYYPGDGSFLGNDGAPLSVQVGYETWIEGPTAPSALWVEGDAIPFTATVHAFPPPGFPPASTPPGGALELLVDGLPAGTSPIDEAGLASFTLSTLAAGTHVVSARYAGQGDFLPTYMAGAVEVTVAAAPQLAATVTGSSSPNPSTTGETVTLTAEVNGASLAPGGTVTFVEDGSALAPPVPVTGCVPSFVAVPVRYRCAVSTTVTFPIGARLIEARYSGDGSFAPAASLPWLHDTIDPPVPPGG